MHICDIQTGKRFASFEGTNSLAGAMAVSPDGKLLMSGHIDGSANFPMPPSWTSQWLRKGDLNEFLGPDKEQSIVFY